MEIDLIQTRALPDRLPVLFDRMVVIFICRLGMNNFLQGCLQALQRMKNNELNLQRIEHSENSLYSQFVVAPE